MLLAKPETYMNLRGLSVRELVAEYEVKPESDLIVIQDELDFPAGYVADSYAAEFGRAI